MITKTTTWAFKPEVVARFMAGKEPVGKEYRHPSDSTHRLHAALQHSQEIKVRRGTGDYGYVYLIQCNEFTKVGCAVDPQSRLRLLQTGCPYPLTILHSIPVGNMIERERNLQRLLRPYHHKREWFRIPEDVLKQLTSLTDQSITARTEKF